jgi:hypothetical protein
LLVELAAGGALKAWHMVVPVKLFRASANFSIDLAGRARRRDNRMPRSESASECR